MNISLEETEYYLLCGKHYSTLHSKHIIQTGNEKVNIFKNRSLHYGKLVTEIIDYFVILRTSLRIGNIKLI